MSRKKKLRRVKAKKLRKKRRNPAPKYELGDIYEDKKDLDPDSDLTPYYVIVAISDDGFVLRPVREVDDKWQYAGETFGAKVDRFGYLKGFKRGLHDRWPGWNKAKRKRKLLRRKRRGRK